MCVINLVFCLFLGKNHRKTWMTWPERSIKYFIVPSWIWGKWFNFKVLFTVFNPNKFIKSSRINFYFLLIEMELIKRHYLFNITRIIINYLHLWINFPVIILLIKITYFQQKSTWVYLCPSVFIETYITSNFQHSRKW